MSDPFLGLLQYMLFFLEGRWSEHAFQMSLTSLTDMCYHHLFRAGAFPHIELRCWLLMGGEYCQEIELAPGKMHVHVFQ